MKTSGSSSLQEFFDASEEVSHTASNNTWDESSFITAPRDERSTTEATASATPSVATPSVTAAEPIEDDEDSHDDAHIPTIRLSSVGTVLEKDFTTVQLEVANDFSMDYDGDNAEEGNFSDEQTHDSNSLAEKGLFPLHKSNSVARMEAKLRSNNSVTTHGSQEIVVEDTAPPPPTHHGRRRHVCREGVMIAEFDFSGLTPGGGLGVGGGAHADEGDDVVAKAVEIDASHASFGSVSGRSYDDLELGDEEPLPYPGRRSSASRSGISRFGDMYSRSYTRFARTGLHCRAELLSATIIKNSPTEQIGINLLRDQTVVYSIARFDEDNESGSLLRHCPFQPGDRLLSINNKRTQHIDSAEVARMLREASGFITIVVHNPGGDPCLIETMITKANKNQRSGMGLKSTGARDLRVSSINEHGLFAHSLLNVGDRILSINEVDVTEVDARVACEIIKNAPDRVTVVARTAHTTGVVVAEVSNRGLRSSFSGDRVLTAVPESSARNRDEIEAYDDTFHLTRKQKEQVMAGLFLLLMLAAIVAGIFGRNPNDSAPKN